MDEIRVLRVIEYTGPRDLVENQIKNSLHGEKTFKPLNDSREMTVRVATVGEFPEILNREVTK